MVTNRAFGSGARAALLVADVLLGALLGLSLMGIAACVSLRLVETVNDSGVPRWIAFALACLLVFVASWIRVAGKMSSRILSLFWALGAACFARPGLREIGFDWRLEPAVILAAFLVGALAVKFPTPKRRSVAMGASCLSAVIAFGVLSLPATGVVLYVSAYIGVLACATASTIATTDRWKWRST